MSQAKIDDQRVRGVSASALFGQHYQTIGAELLRFDQATRYSYDLFPAFSQFREGVAFCPVELLESYLEDLLDSNKSCDELSIGQSSCMRKRLALPLLGLAIVVSCGIHFAGKGASVPGSLMITMLSAIPFGFMLHLAVTHESRRRMKFAQVLSREISRRRGGDREGKGLTRSQLIFSDWFTAPPPPPQQTAARGLIH